MQGPTLPIPRERERLGPFARTRSITEPGPWFETCNIVYEAELLERLDGFDEAFAEALGEDTDLGWRAVGLGAEHVWAEDAARSTTPSTSSDRSAPSARRSRQRLGARLRRHRGLRARTLRWGVVRNPSLPQLGLAVAGLALSPPPPRRAAPRPPLRARPRRRAVATSAPARSTRPVYVAADVAAALDARCAARPATAGW